MDVHDSLLELIGGTPLLRLRSVTRGVRPDVLAKLEFLNPGGSVKDRPALSMIEAAERDGNLRRGSTIVEPTSGNTGVGLAMVAQQKGYRCVFTCPDKVSAEKRNVLRALGAEVIVCPASAGVDSPDFYRNVSERLARELPEALTLNQYANLNNPRAHYETTGPELWTQTEGRITHFVAALGTGGTISGAGSYLKEVSHGRVVVVGADPEGSAYSGDEVRPYVVEGVGQPFLPVAYDAEVVDRVIAVSDRDSIEITRRLALEEGLLVGGSSGMVVAAARTLAEDLDSNDIVVVVLPDSGRGYMSKLFNDEWLGRFGFGRAAAGIVCVADALGDDEPVGVAPDETVRSTVRLMSDRALTCLPVFEAEPPVRAAEVLGTVVDRNLAGALADGSARPDDPVGPLMTPPLPFVGAGQALAEVVPVLSEAGAALVLDAGLFRGVLCAHHVMERLGDTQLVRTGSEESRWQSH